MTNATASTAASGKTFLKFIDLDDNVTGLNMSTFYLATLTGIMLASFAPQISPYLLREFLEIPSERHGKITGQLAFLSEIVIIATSGLWGVCCDKFGRRAVMTASYVILTISWLAFPRVETYTELLIARGIFGLGIAGYSVAIVTIVADYVLNRSRGKATGLMGMGNGLGAVTSAILLLKLPAFYQTMGMTEVEAGIRTFDTVAVMTLLCALCMWFGLKKDHDIKREHKSVGGLQLAREGLVAARDPGIALAYGAAFIARGNVALVGAFFSLWLISYGTSVEGMTTAEASGKAGTMLGITGIFALLTAPLFGIMTDRMNRVHALMVTLAVAFIGYAGTYFVENPFGIEMIICVFFIGAAEVGCIITSGVLIAEQAPTKIRGSAIGFFTLCGAFGILVSSLIGGYLFDHWLMQGPFVFFGFMALAVLIAAVLLRKRIKPPPADLNAPPVAM